MSFLPVAEYRWAKETQLSYKLFDRTLQNVRHRLSCYGANISTNEAKGLFCLFGSIFGFMFA